MAARRQWNLGAKLALIAAPFLVLTMLAIGVTLWVSWQLEGGAAAINEGGRMRMQTYRMSLSISIDRPQQLQQQATEFTRALEALRVGDPERPMFVPWDDTVLARFAAVQRDWQAYRARWIEQHGNGAGTPALLEDTTRFVADIDRWVRSMEAHMARWTALLHLAQVFTMALALAGTIALVVTGYLFVLEPLGQLEQAIGRIQGGDFSARVRRHSSDEFGTLSDGFNGMAAHVQLMYQTLEARVAEKTAELEEKRERLEALYSVTSLVAKAASLPELAQGFVQRLRRIARADAIALRWSDQANTRFLMLASEGLPGEMVLAEQCLHAGQCHCGAAEAPSGLRVVPIRSSDSPDALHCRRAGFQTVASIPIHLHDSLMGEVALFFHAQHTISASDRSLLEALTAHLAAAMENVRLQALERESAVAHERGFIARELHDSIAQSLAFLKIQVQLMHDALGQGDPLQVQAVLQEIDAGVRESYADVRELLVHFRTRTASEDIEPALQTTLRKFELQSTVSTTLRVEGHGLPLAPDRQVQVLHIVQEALSNIRKHADATQVWLDVQQQPHWRFEIRDNGRGFDAQHAGSHDETHVGLRIMRERAERIGAQLEVLSTPGRGSSVILTLAPMAPQPGPNQAGARPNDAHAGSTLAQA